MRSKITASGQRADGAPMYIEPAEWRDYEWINDPGNYPDPEYTVFQDEYDWDCRDSKGLIYKYIKHIEGSAYLGRLGKNPKRHQSPSPKSYYMFAMAAVHLHNNPKLIRDTHKDQIHGGFVVNYANSIQISALVNLNTVVSTTSERLQRKKHLIPVTFSSLFARVFNETSGIDKEYYLKTAPREDRKHQCPSCGCIYEQLSKKYKLPGDPGFEDWSASAIEQREDRAHRNMTGNPKPEVDE